MKSIRITIIIAIAALILSACSGGGTTTKLNVVERATTDTVGDVAPEGDSVGDVLGFANEVYDETNSNKVGADNGMCVRTQAPGAWECIWTLTLSDGQLTVEGPFYDTQDSMLAITGGTGAYANARGQMTLHARNAQGTEYDFKYEITK